MCCFSILDSNSSIAKSQSKDSIEIKKSKFFQNERILRAAEVVNIMKPYPDAFNEMKSAKSQLDAANVFSFIGGGLFGWSVGGWIGGGDFNWGLAGAGAGLMVVSIPFYTSYSKKAGSAVELYNQSINNSSHRPVIMEKFQAIPKSRFSTKQKSRYLSR